MIESAIAFAVKAHEGQLRKGTDIPYIMHPIDTMMIMQGEDADEELMAAAILHDVVEDAGVSKEELIDKFGERVAGLVLSVSEDKSKSWRERKEAAVKNIASADDDVKLLALCDKLSNIRCMETDYELVGEKLWERFNVKDRESHAWYYRSMAKSLEALKDREPYKEYLSICSRLFGQDTDKERADEILTFSPAGCRNDMQ